MCHDIKHHIIGGLHRIGTDRGEGGQNHRPRLYNAREGKRMDKLPDESGGDGG